MVVIPRRLQQQHDIYVAGYDNDDDDNNNNNNNNNVNTESDGILFII
jgi:hypothetical protein